MITQLDTVSWCKSLTTGNSAFVETPSLDLYIVSNVRNIGFGFGSGFGISFGSPYQFAVLQSDPVPPSPGPGDTFGAIPPASIPKAIYTFPQPNLSFDPVTAFDPATGLLHILGSRNTPTSGSSSSPTLSDLIKFTYDTNAEVLSGPFVIAASVGSRVRGAFDIAVLPSGNTIIAASLTEPMLARTTISTVGIVTNTVTLTFPAMPVPFIPGQWILLDDLTTATTLNGQLLQVIDATATTVTAYFTASNYPTTADTGTASPVGSSLLAVEIDSTTNLPVPTTATILDSSPLRTGDTFDGVSLLVYGNSVELYYQSHPKNITFSDQVFSINFIGRDYPPDGGFGINFGYKFGLPLGGFAFDFGFEFGLSQEWDAAPVTLFTFTARYTDNRLTVFADSSGNRFMNLTYWSQLNHPEGIVGSVLVGRKFSSSNWFFHPTFGTTLGGSIIQSTLSVAQNGAVSLAYLLQPFVPVTNPPAPTAASWPLKVASVDPNTLGLTDMPGSYNTASFTWLRGTKSVVDSESLWAVVGERETTAVASGESHVIPVLSLPPQPFTIQVNSAASYFGNVEVVYAVTLLPLMEVATNPLVGQYTVDETTGVYTFNQADAGVQVLISYNYVNAILPVYASLFNVPPVTEAEPLSATVWRGGTFYATDVSTVVGFFITSNVLTVACTNDFVTGQKIAIYGFNTSVNQFLNGVTLTVATASPTQFTAAFTHPNFNSAPDSGFAALLVPGTLVLSAANSTDSDSDPLQWIWTENDPNPNISLSTAGALAAVNVAKAVGPNEHIFDVGVAVVDLFPDLVTVRHPALNVENIEVSGGVLTVTFDAPAGAIVPIAGEQVMFYDVVLGAPSAPILTTTAGGSLPVQGAPGFSFLFGGGFGEFNPISVIVTYVNAAGETVGSVNSLIAAIPASQLLVVQSPSSAGDAVSYNVYVGSVGNETLQPNYPSGLFTPQMLGTNWQEPDTGFTSIFVFPPTQSTAAQEFLNDQVATLTATGPNTLLATFPLGFADDFGFDFGALTLPSTSVTGFVISQFQFQQIIITVPQDVAPTATFPAPQWVGNVLQTTLKRNTTLTITPGIISNPLIEFPVVYTGITDPDDQPTFLWQQVSGSTVNLPNGSTSSSIVISTAGVNLNGEALVFSLTINDGVSPAFVTQFTINVAAYVFSATNHDTLQLSRSIYSTNAHVTNVQILNGVAVVQAVNGFSEGQTIWFEGLTNATFLNGASYTVLPTGFGSSFSAGFGNPSLSGTEFTIAGDSLPNYGPAADSGTAYATLPISQRNSPPTAPNLPWSPLDISVIYTDLQSVKRTSVLDGSDRYIVVSPFSVLVYGVFPAEVPIMVLLRKIFLPDNTTTILDAVHTEQDYTLVLDSQGQIHRYSQAPFINTDNPDTTIDVSTLTSLSFADTDDANDVHILTTQSFGNQRVVALTGEEGTLLVQLNTTTLSVTGTFELSVASNFVYGASKAQFVRWVNMDNLHSGLILLGTIANQSAVITSVGLGSVTFNTVVYAANTLLVVCDNTFAPGDKIVISGLTTSPSTELLNGLTVEVVASLPTGFIASLSFPTAQAPVWDVTRTYTTGQVVNFNGNPFIAVANVPINTPPPNVSYWAVVNGIALSSDVGLAQSQNSGSTFETLVDLAASQIIGTFDKSKLRNQFVATGEILFVPDDTYSGGPTPPQLLEPTTLMFGGVTQINLAWSQLRSDLINSYTVQYAVDNPVSAEIPLVAPFTVTVPSINEFTADEGVFDTVTSVPLTRTTAPSPLVGQYFVDETTGTYTFNIAQAGNGIVITIRQEFQNYQIINSGNVQSLFVQLPLGRTYFFQVQASGLDGTSAFSNIVSITI